MIKGNSQYIKDIIDDSNKSIRTTYSSEKIEDLISSFSDKDVFFIKLSSSAPIISSSDDMYYNTTTKKLHKVDNNAWDSGSVPSEDVLYVGRDKKLYVYSAGDMQPISGSGSTTVSEKEHNAVENIVGSTDQKEDGLYVEDVRPIINQLDLTTKINKYNESEFFFLTGTMVSPWGDRNPSVPLPSISNSSSGYDMLYLMRNETLNTTMDSSRYDLTKNSNALNAGSYLVLKAGIRYKIEFMLLINSKGSFGIYDETGKAISSRGYTGVSVYTDTPAISTVKYDKDTKIYFKFYNNGLPPATVGSFFPACSYIKVEAMNILAIDPLEHIDLNQGIQDTPVGEVIEVLGDKVPTHYIHCDGTEYSIGTYPALEQHFRDIGKINMFGGDGVTTYRVPKRDSEAYLSTSFLPEMTSNNTPVPCVASADSIYSTLYQPYMAFNSLEGDENRCWHSSSGTSHWLQIDYGVPTKINAFNLKGRAAYSMWYDQMPTEFKLQGSNDDTNFTDIETYSGVTWGSKIEVRFELSKEAEYRFYRLADMKSTSGVICFNKVEFMYEVYKYPYIKYEPTYFIGKIEGTELREDLISAPVIVPFTSTVESNETISLLKSIDSFDYIEVQTTLVYDTVNPELRGKHITRIPVSEITFVPADSKGWIDAYQEMIISSDAYWTIWYRFQDKDTLRISRLHSTTTGINKFGYRISSVVGIRNAYKIGS